MTIAMRGLGLPRWGQRLVRAGWRTEQSSNAYVLVPTAAAPVTAPHCGGQAGREIRRIEIPYCPQFTAAEIQVAQATLAQRRAVVEARLLGKKGRIPQMSAMIDMPTALRNILQQLQQDPRRYKLFGIYWWPTKALLKRHGYGPAELYMLGPYLDQTTAALVPKMGLEETLRTALEEYGRNATFPHPGGMVEDPDGEMVILYDEDAGI
jgi:hypothetical protein